MLQYKETIKTRPTICLSINHKGIVCQLSEDSINVNDNIMKSNREMIYGKWAHPLSIHNQFFYTFEFDGWSIWDMEKMALAEQVTTESCYCGDAGVWDQVCTAHDKSIVVWDIRQRKPYNCILAHSMQITACNFSDNGNYIVTAAQDNYCRILGTGMSECISTLSTSKVQHTTYAKFTKDCKHVLISTLSNPISLWDWAKSEQKANYFGNINERFYLEPYIIYNQSKPSKIITSNDNSQIVLFNFLNPQKIPTILKYKKKILIFESLKEITQRKPIRVSICEQEETNKLIYVWQAGLPEVFVYELQND